VTLFTLGYGGRMPQDVVALLRVHGVRSVVDIRLRPDRASMRLWAKAKTADKGLERWLRDAGFGYRSLVELGNLFLDRPDWWPRYEALLDACGGLLTERLANIPGPLCLLCAEKQPAECHRTLVAAWLAQHTGVDVMHIT
jgi:uncharacterized protein (DUF488 family)